LTSNPPCKPAPSTDNDPSTKFLKAILSSLSYHIVLPALFPILHTDQIIQWMLIQVTESSLMRGLLKKEQAGVLEMRHGEKRIV
jgi:hypothetical protein